MTLWPNKMAQVASVPHGTAQATPGASEKAQGPPVPHEAAQVSHVPHETAQVTPGPNVAAQHPEQVQDQLA